jgi:hypothetical protein
VVLLPAFLWLEYPTIAVNGYFMMLLCVGASLALFLNVAELTVVQKTSAVTMWISGAAKLILLTVVTSTFFQHPMSLLNIAGVLVTSMGVTLHGYTKSRDLAEAGNSKVSALSAMKYTSLITDDSDLSDLELSEFEQ